jgi:hypothetical protein
MIVVLISVLSAILVGMAAAQLCTDVCTDAKTNLCFTAVGYCPDADYPWMTAWWTMLSCMSSGWCNCNVFGFNCEACHGCREFYLTDKSDRGIFSSTEADESVIRGADIPGSVEDYKWYTELPTKDKLAHLNVVVCQRYGYGAATSVQLVKEVDDRADKNHLDEDEKNNNGRVDDGILSHEEFSAAYFDVDDLAAKYCSPIQGKSGKNTKTGKMGKR